MITATAKLDIQKGDITIDLEIRPDYDVQVDLYDYILKSLKQPSAKVTLTEITEADGTKIVSGHGKIRVHIDGKGVLDLEAKNKPITKVALNPKKPAVSTTKVYRSQPLPAKPAVPPVTGSGIKPTVL
jgi:ribosomal protein L24E